MLAVPAGGEPRLVALARLERCDVGDADEIESEAQRPARIRPAAATGPKASALTSRPG